MHEFERIGRDLEKSFNFVTQNHSLGGGRNSWKSGSKFPKIWSWGPYNLRRESKRIATYRCYHIISLQPPH